MEPSRIVPFTKGIRVTNLGDIPLACTLCTWVYRNGGHELKFANNFCSVHGELTYDHTA